MKVFSIFPYTEKGVRIVKKPFPHVSLGEQGRGRELVKVPVEESFATLFEDGDIIKDASVFEKDGAYIIGQETEDDSSKALVLFAVPAGYRGSTSIRFPYCKTRGNVKVAVKDEKITAKVMFSYKNRKTRNEMENTIRGMVSSHGMSRAEEKEWGNNKVIFTASLKPGDKFHLVQGATSDKQESEIAFVDVPKNIFDVKVIAKGYCAQGDAGRMGGHEELLVIMDAGVKTEIYRDGNLYGGSSAFVAEWTGEEMRSGTPDEIDPPSDVSADLLQNAEVL